MKIRLATDDNEEIYIFLVPTLDSFGCQIWNSTTPPSLRLYESKDGALAKIEKDISIRTPNDEITSQYLAAKLELIEEESSGIEFSSEDELEYGVQPYDPDLIRVDTKPFSVQQTFDLLQVEDIDLAPDFQRHFVWKEIEKRSRLIESIMLRIPLPVFYLAQDAEGRFQVVDGVQRLTVIKQFLNNDFRLKNLEYLKDCEGKYYRKGENNYLDPKYVRRISQTQLIFNIIDPQTPARVKFEIFKRINQGGKPLKSQEIRNCMASPQARRLLSDLANSAEFKLATNHGVNPVRMEDQELVLRFIAFYYAENLSGSDFRYSGNMDVFLDDTLDLINRESFKAIEHITSMFIRAMKNARHLFGHLAFRKISSAFLQGRASTPFINKSLFTSWSVALAQLSYESVCTHEEACLLEPLARKIEEDSRYFDSITNGTNDAARIRYSFDCARLLINQLGN